MDWPAEQSGNAAEVGATEIVKRSLRSVRRQEQEENGVDPEKEQLRWGCGVMRESEQEEK